MASARKRGLGKGLGALIPSVSDNDAPAPKMQEPAREQSIAPAVAQGDGLVYIDPSAILPNPKQPRTVFEETALQELADSIRNDGVIEPVIVRRSGDGYELVSGERRVKASVMADLETIPAVCREVTDRDMLKIGLIENIQREDLNAIETAEAYEALMDEFGWTQEEMAREVGKSRVSVANMLRLLNLPNEVRDGLATGEISMGHARALLALPHESAQRAAYRKVLKEGLSVRQTEALATKSGGATKKKSSTGSAAKDPNVASLENDLRRHLGTKVHVRPSGKEKGKLEIEYYSYDDLERILDIIQGRQ